MQRRNSRSHRSLLLSAAPWVTLLLLAAEIPQASAVPLRNRNEFERCAAELLSTGIAPEQASVGCAKVWHPREVSKCVANINRQTPITATDALSVCFRSRRPEELASCVTDINKIGSDTNGLAMLDYCRRSLLPIRFSECVVALHREMDISASSAMETCISAND
jgi:hypothetical protein